MSTSKHKILVVEDEMVIAMLLKEYLSGWGYEVLGPVVSGNAAMTKAREARPDLILMDISIRGSLDGIQTSIRIRQEHNTPIVFLTSHSDEKTYKQALATDPAGYLTKPIVETELFELLSTILSS